MVSSSYTGKKTEDGSFWLVKCTSCGFDTWNTHYSEICLKCDSEAICIPASQEKSNWVGTIKKPV